ncbi:tail fiber domain-containing protein [Cohnella sp. REN36]|uniref:tail fiber domain-containing protein n=1 Tax=Cohnella sp. REN36 TaxID=2887347 RepID=UPI001D140F84|nr:tail fiber domain-containing protein [Cohnella sp. REN36]
MEEIQEQSRSVMPHGRTTPQRFGAAGDGATDDTEAIQAALNALGSSGGGTLDIGSARYAVGNLNVPPYVTIRGELANPEQVHGATVSYYTLPSSFIQLIGTTITLNSGSVFERAVAIREGLSLPAATDEQAAIVIGQFSGTAFIAADTGAAIQDALILGHELAYSSDCPQGGGRTRMNNVKIDAHNGVAIRNEYDIARLHDVHCWPFLTVHAAGVTPASLRRPGTAFSLARVDDWSQLSRCFAYGYTIGFSCDGTSNIRLLECDVDGPDTVPGSRGFSITGEANKTKLIGCTVNSLETALYIDLNEMSKWPEVSTVDCSFAPGVTGVDLVGGFLMSVNDKFYSGTYGYAIGAGAHFAKIMSPYWNNVPQAVTVHPEAEKNVELLLPKSGHNVSNAYANQINGNLSVRSYDQPSAAGTGPCFDLKGNYASSTGMYARLRASLASASPGREAADLLIAASSGGELVERWKFHHEGHFYPVIDQSANLGGANHRWASVYTVNGAIQASDAAQVADVQEIDEVLLDAFASIRPKQFRMKDAKDAKGSAARWHVGYLAQDLEAAIRSQGADPAKYGLWCKDEVVDEIGMGTGVYRQSLRYEQIAVLRDALERHSRASGG